MKQYRTPKENCSRMGWSLRSQERYIQKHGLPYIQLPTGRKLFRDDLTDSWAEKFLKNTPDVHKARQTAEQMMAGIVRTNMHKREDGVA